MGDIFNKEFWIDQWEDDKKSDTFNVHRGFATPEYWDNAAGTYNKGKKEVKERRLEKVISELKREHLLFSDMEILEIGCGTGLLAMELAKHGAKITALDFSVKMLERFKEDITPDIEKNITLLHEDWYKIDIEARQWKKKFDLVIAFMSPGVATPESFFKMMNCSKNGCAMQGWAAKRAHPILSDLWEIIKQTPLEDKPQSILYKINLLFSLNCFPVISFSTIEWQYTSSVEQECHKQIEFFKKVSRKSHDELEKIIRPYLESIAKGGTISREHKGLTAIAIWKVGSKLFQNKD